MHHYSSSPVVILFAVYVSIPRKASQLRVQWQLALAAFQAVRMPLSVHRQEVVPVVDAASAAGARRRVQASAPETRRLTLLQHSDGEEVTTRRAGTLDSRRSEETAAFNGRDVLDNCGKIKRNVRAVPWRCGV